jgi:putative membrane protein
MVERQTKTVEVKENTQMTQRVKGGASLALASVLSMLCVSAIAQDVMNRPVNPGGPKPRLVVLSGPDKEFALKTLDSNLREIEWSRLAETNASSDAVKRLARRMIDDHSEMERNIIGLADMKEWNWRDEWKWRNELTLTQMRADPPMEAVDVARTDPDWRPDMKRDPIYTRFTSLKGADFDSAYLRYLENSHKMALRNFREAINTADDPDIQFFARRFMPTIRSHYDMVREMREGRLPSSLSGQ